MKTQKKNEHQQKIFLFLLMGLFFFTLFLRPQYNDYRNNQLLLANKRKILEASRLEISEDEYLKKLNGFELELDRYRQLIPDQEDQQDLYDGLKEVIEKSQVELIELHFGTAFIVETNDLLAEEKVLYGIPIKTRIEGDALRVKMFFKALKDACPLMTIDSFNIEERQAKMVLDLELWGYFF